MPGAIFAMEPERARAARLRTAAKARERLAQAAETPARELPPAASAGPPRAIVSAAEVEARRLARQWARAVEAQRAKSGLAISTAANALIRSIAEAEAEMAFADAPGPSSRRGLQPAKHPRWEVVGEDGKPITTWRPAVEARTGRILILWRRGDGVFVARYQRRTPALAHLTGPERLAFAQAVRTYPETAARSAASTQARKAFRAALDRARALDARGGRAHG